MRSGYRFGPSLLLLGAAIFLAARPVFAGGGGGTVTTPIVLDDGLGTASATELHASWMFPNSGNISQYQYQIRRDSPSGAVLVGWTSTGTATWVIRSGLSLTYGVTYFFSVRAKDKSAGWSAPAYSDGIRVNRPPTAAVTAPAGAVDGGLPIRLDATGSQDPDGDALRYSWRQVAGPAVPLADSGSPTPTFESPFVRPEDTLQFQVTVSDGIAAAAAIADVIIAAAPLPAVDLQVSATTVQVGQPFTLTTTGNAAAGIQAVWWYGIDTGVTAANVVLNLPAEPTSDDIFTTPFTNPVKLDRAFGSPRFSSNPRVTSYTFTSDITINQPGVFQFGANMRDVLEGQPADATGHPMVTVTVQSSDPAQITYPQSNQMVSGDSVEVMGTASIAGFERFDLEYGDGPEPAFWYLVQSSTTPVVNGVLATVPFAGTTQEQLSVRLRLVHNGGQLIERVVTFRPLELHSMSLTPPYMSPNGDDTNDSATFSATATQPVQWWLNIVSPTSQTVRSYGGSGTAISVVWDGRNQSSQVVPDGLYRAVLQVVSPTTGLEDADATTSVTVDATSPVAVITAPAPGASIEGVLAVMGTASDAGPLTYSVTLYDQFYANSQSITDGLLATLDTAADPNGPAGLVLQVTDYAGNVAQVSVPIVIANLLGGDVSADPVTIDPVLGEQATVRFSLGRPASVALRVYDASTHALIRTLLSNMSLPAGPQTVPWDGRDDASGYADPQAYYFTINVQDGQGATAHYNEPGAPIMGPQPFVFNGFSTLPNSFNPYSNDEVVISYDLTAHARLILEVNRSAVRPTTLIMDRVPVEQGQHTVRWDCRHGNGDTIVREGFAFRFDVPQPLPLHPIIVESAALQIESVRTEPYLIQPVFGEVSTLSYTLTRPGMVSIAIVDPNGNHVRTLIANAQQPAGTHSQEWNGLADDGTFAAVAGNYRIVITASDPLTGYTAQWTGSILVNR